MGESDEESSRRKESLIAYDMVNGITYIGRREKAIGKTEDQGTFILMKEIVPVRTEEIVKDSSYEDFARNLYNRTVERISFTEINTINICAKHDLESNV